MMIILRFHLDELIKKSSLIIVNSFTFFYSKWMYYLEETITIAILSRLRQNFILKKFWEIEYLTIRKKLK